MLLIWRSFLLQHYITSLSIIYVPLPDFGWPSVNSSPGLFPPHPESFSHMKRSCYFKHQESIIIQTTHFRSLINTKHHFFIDIPTPMHNLKSCRLRIKQNLNEVRRENLRQWEQPLSSQLLPTKQYNSFLSKSLSLSFSKPKSKESDTTNRTIQFL